ncbi:MAG: hypothetical protein K1Y36_00600 [Blastocatellia bacterium]|nr:hypothetical protein [Blastocatellia bacterium]
MNNRNQSKLHIMGRYVHPKVIVVGLTVFTFVSISFLWQQHLTELEMAGMKLFACPAPGTSTWYLAWAAIAVCSRNLLALGYAVLVSGAGVLNGYRNLCFLLEEPQTAAEYFSGSTLEKLRMFEQVLAVIIFTFALATLLQVISQRTLPHLKRWLGSAKTPLPTKLDLQGSKTT